MEDMRVCTVQDMPSCFSRPICQFAMFLNDQASNEVRQRLLSFVMRLACADGEEVEQQRQTYISAKTTSFKESRSWRARSPSDGSASWQTGYEA